MNPLAFRVWDDRKKEFFYFDIPSIMSSEATNPLLVALKMGVVTYDSPTCLQDKNGILVYENDLVNTVLHKGLRVRIPVIYIVLSWGSEFFRREEAELEIVGNIYINPRGEQK